MVLQFHFLDLVLLFTCVWLGPLFGLIIAVCLFVSFGYVVCLFVVLDLSLGCLRCLLADFNAMVVVLVA